MAGGPTPTVATGGKKKTNLGARLAAVGALLGVVAALGFGLYTLTQRKVETGDTVESAASAQVEVSHNSTAERTQTSSRVTSTVSPPSPDWQTITAPPPGPNGDTFSNWVKIPPGYQILFCDPEADPGCKASSLEGALFRVQCRDFSTRQPRDLADPVCRYSDVNRFQSAENTSRVLMYRMQKAS